MTRKITLSIPDMLHDKMEEWRKSFNLSKMFQDALTEAIHKKEEFQRRMQEDSDMSEIIERLRREKKLSEGNYSESGRIKGLQWAKNAHYDDLMHVLCLQSPGDVAKDTLLSHYFNDIDGTDEHLEFSGDNPNKYTKLFLEGWQKGVSEFWNVIKEKI